ncbi:hypothetical protein ACFQ1E_07105 [Sphingomonas canadensis]|uniref:Uncharacterized protein n=1 Tax=Sphingomonas canadensis TaxID=1219257 RepID=A0ABW3H7G4_9SPHN|nr:hypothetical protein [Sphingomonas canadensis]MCW3835447.1 hypothetical protein [Sphingomonas canadensis]
MGAIIDFATSSPVLYSMTALGGMVAGVWIDTLLARRERSPSRAPKPAMDEPDSPRLAPPFQLPTLATHRPLDSTGFDYPYPKAVLQASIAKPKGTLEARQDGVPYKMSIIIQIENVHDKAINEWYAILDRIQVEGESLNLHGAMKVAKNLNKIEPGQRKNILLLSRDISDKVSKPPFLIRLAERDFPLKENKEYLVGIELHSGNPYYTDVLLSIKTGKDLEAQVKVIHQSPSLRRPQDTERETRP